MFNLLIVLLLVSGLNSQILDLGTDCGLGTQVSENKIYGGSIAKKGDWGWQVFNLFQFKKNLNFIGLGRH